MFVREKAMFSKIIDRIKLTGFICRIIFYAFGILAPLYAIISHRGILPIHICLIFLSVISLVLYMVYHSAEDVTKKERLKYERKAVKKLRRHIVRFSRLYIILAAVYAVYFTATKVNVFSVILLSFMIVIFVTELVFSLLLWVAKKKIKPLSEAVSEEYSAIKQAIKEKNL